MLQQYELHNKLLNLWSKLFPNLTCNQVDKGEQWIRLSSKVDNTLMMYTTTGLTAWDEGVIVLCINFDLLPFNRLQ